MEKPSVLSKEDFDYIDNISFKDNGKTLSHWIYNPENVTLFFKKGIIIFTIEVLNYDGYDNERVCSILYLYKDKKETKLDWKEFIEKFKEFAKENRCTKILMCTEFGLNFWIKDYGFKIKKYEMELEL